MTLWATGASFDWFGSEDGCCGLWAKAVVRQSRVVVRQRRQRSPDFFGGVVT